MILNICTERQVKFFRQIYLPVREHTCLIGSGGMLQCVAVCCSVWQYVAVCGSMLQCAASQFTRQRLFQFLPFSGCCSALRCTTRHKVMHHTVYCSVL